MNRPRARIVRIVLDHDVAIWPQHLSISALRVPVPGDANAIPRTAAFVDNVHVVAV